MNDDLSENKKEDIETTLYKPDRLIGISVQAKVIAWIILAVSILFLIIFTIEFANDVFSSGYGLQYRDLYYYFLGLLPVLFGLFFYILLRAVAEGIYLFIDIETGLRELKERGK